MNVLITGASGGLGRAFSIECARRGYNLFLTDIGEEKLSTIRKGVLRQYPDIQVEIGACDLTDTGSVDVLLEAFNKKSIAFDMLLNVAGVDYEGGFMERDASQIEKIIRLNIEATLRITHLVLERRPGNDSFFIVFVSSLASLYPMPLKATYAASKRFLLDFSIALGEELEAQKVSVLSLCPAGLPTTEESIQGITAQGFWGEATTNSPEIVARKTIDKVLRGEKVYIPGFANQFFSTVGGLLPKTWIAKIVYARWSIRMGKDHVPEADL